MMARIRTNSRLQVQNRERVRKYRIIKKLRKNHEDHVRAQIQQLKPPTFDSEIHEPRSTDDGVEKNDFDIRARLRIWAVTHRITHMAINDLLTILILAGFASLPRDSRTLMHTPVSVNITTLTNGKFWYQGLRECLGNIFFSKSIVTSQSCLISTSMGYRYSDHRNCSFGQYCRQSVVMQYKFI